MLPEHIELLKKNPALSQDQVRQANIIIDRLANCSGVESSQEKKLMKTMVFPSRGGGKFRFFEILDDPLVFDKIELGFITGPFCTVRNLLDKPDKLKNFLTFWPMFDSKPIEEQPKPQHELRFCEIVHFILEISSNFGDWIEDETYDGILFKFKEIKEQPLQETTWFWFGTKGCFECPDYLLDKYINAIQKASAEYHSGAGLGRMGRDQSGYYVFQPKIKIVDRKPGFVAQDGKIFAADQVPWAELANDRVLVTK